MRDRSHRRTVWHRVRRTIARVMTTCFILTLAGVAESDSSFWGPGRRLAFVDIRTTSFGVPHVRAWDYFSMGFGLGFVYARDNLCILAREVVTARGEETKYFGPSNDFVQRSILFSHLHREEVLQANFDAQPREIRDAMRGYAAGYNRYLRETGVENLPSACANAPWVRPLDVLDLAAAQQRGTARASVGPLNGAIVTAFPPGTPAAPVSAIGDGGAQAVSALSAEAPASPLPEIFTFPELEKALNLNENFPGGSNAYGLGRDVTRNGRGMLLGNPHEPWEGIQRFYEAHLEVIGRYNAMGAVVGALPVVVIGFNRGIAWSHTVSTAKRFTVHELTLDPLDPLTYLVVEPDGTITRESIEAIPVEYSVLGESTPRVHLLYRSRFGLMLNVRALNPAAPAWGDNIALFGGPSSVAYTLQDVNEGNLRGLEQWLQIGQARHVPELKAVLEETVGLPFVNTIAADRFGSAFYGDVGAVPNVPTEKLLACGGSFVARLFSQSGIFTLDGSRRECDWETDPAAPQAGILPGQDLPSLIRSDYVSNSNDSYWLSNLDERLEGFPAILRRNTVVDERSPRILRTRMGLQMILDRLAGVDGLRGTRFTLRRLQRIFYSNRNYSGEVEADAILDLCESDSPPTDAWPTSLGEPVDATEACRALAQWDRTDNLDSIGVPVWREFFGPLGRSVDKFSIPFDEADPVGTPRALTINDRIVTTFGDAVAKLNDLGIAPDSPLGEVQFVTGDDLPRAADDSNVIPMHGGLGQNGVFNVATTPGLTSEGYTPVVQGPTYMQTVTWDRYGRVVADAILGFSQSDDPENPHFADQTRRYSNKDFVRLPFSNRAIRRDQVSREFLFEWVVDGSLH